MLELLGLRNIWPFFRRMFPVLSISISGLDSEASYSMMVDMECVDSKRYRYSFHQSKWTATGPGQLKLSCDLSDLQKSSKILAVHLAWERSRRRNQLPSALRTERLGQQSLSIHSRIGELVPESSKEDKIQTFPSVGHCKSLYWRRTSSNCIHEVYRMRGASRERNG